MHDLPERGQVHYRPGTHADNHAAYLVLAAAFADLRRRNEPEQPVPSPAEAQAELENGWRRSEPLFDHLTRSGEQFWVAEHGGAVVGYARATMRDGLRELTELFVAPQLQAAGVGRELLSRAFPVAGAQRRVVIAVPNMAAQVLYMRAGVYPRVPIAHASREPELVELPLNLELRPMDQGDADLATLAVIDAEVLGFRRDQDHRYLGSRRRGMLVLRDGRPVGYGYLGDPGGPWALLDPADYPAMLAYAEHTAAREGWAFGLQVPMLNQRAIEYLLRRGCRLNRFPAQLMADQPFGQFDRYIVNSPMFFV